MDLSAISNERSVVFCIDDSQSDAASDDEDDDEEEDQDILEADLDKNELLKAHEVDLIGDRFLSVNYSEPATGAQRKRRVCCSTQLLKFCRCSVAPVRLIIC